MRTRHLTMVQLDNEIKVAQYGQWDGYLTGAGKTIAEFISLLVSENQIDLFKSKVRLCQFINNKQRIDLMNKVVGHKREFITMEESDKLRKALPSLHRDTGANVLSLILKSKTGLALVDDSSFANDSLFCEWAYVINLDSEVLEVYEGFNKDVLSPNERFYSSVVDSSGYRAVKLLEIIPFSIIDDCSMDEFENYLSLSDQEKEESLEQNKETYI